MSASHRPGGGRPETHEAAEMRVGWRMAGLGMEVATTVVAGALLGWLFDWWRGHGRLGVSIGAVAGISVALWTLIRGALKLNRELERKHPTAGRGNPLPHCDDPERDEWNDRDEDAGEDWNTNRFNERD